MPVFQYHPDILARYPSIVGGVILAHGMTNSPTPAKPIIPTPMLMLSLHHFSSRAPGSLLNHRRQQPGNAAGIRHRR